MSSDFVSNYNNKEMADLERRIRALYSHAHDEILQDSSKQWKKIEEGIRDKYEEYQVGKITQQDYYAWVNGNKKLAKIKDQTAANVADRMVDSANIASSYINSTTPNIFAENANREAYKIEKGLKGSVSFSLIDDDALQKIMTGNTVEFKAKWKDTFTDPPKIYNWTYSKVQDSVYIGMLKGESMKKVADRIQQVTGSDEATAIRNARTSVISASNQGKMATFERAAKMGIKVKKEWVSARDNRVRDSHAALNGIQVEWDKKFPNGLKCPCDPSGRPEEVYNCRCTMVRVPFDEEDTSGNTEKNYQVWKETKEEFTRRYVADDGHEIIDKATYEKLTKTFINSGGIIIRGDEAARHLKVSGASASFVAGANVAFIRDDATVSDVLEEMYHAKQHRSKKYGVNVTDKVHLKREIDAQKYLLSCSEKYKIPVEEIEATKRNLEYYQKKLKELSENE